MKHGQESEKQGACACEELVEHRRDKGVVASVCEREWCAAKRKQRESERDKAWEKEQGLQQIEKGGEEQAWAAAKQQQCCWPWL